jgi:hypothetical protein
MISGTATAKLRSEIASMQSLLLRCNDSGIRCVIEHFIEESKNKLAALSAMEVGIPERTETFGNKVSAQRPR